MLTISNKEYKKILLKITASELEKKNTVILKNQTGNKDSKLLLCMFLFVFILTLLFMCFVCPSAKWSNFT